MNYIISEEELNKLVGAFCPMTRFDKERLKDFLKSKQPVQVLDRGNVLKLTSVLIHRKLTPEDFMTDILSLIPKQKPTEVEIRDILEKVLMPVLPIRVKYSIEPGEIYQVGIEEVSKEIFIEMLARKLSNLYKGDKNE